jgi:hypothetical protein
VVTWRNDFNEATKRFSIEDPKYQMKNKEGITQALSEALRKECQTNGLVTQIYLGSIPSVQVSHPGNKHKGGEGVDDRVEQQVPDHSVHPVLRGPAEVHLCSQEQEPTHHPGMPARGGHQTAAEDPETQLGLGTFG